MASYLITGASRGIGFEFMVQLSKNPANTIIGLVRDKPQTEKRVKEELSDRQNIYILSGNMNQHGSLKASVAAVSEVTGGKLDYLIANAALMTDWSGLEKLDVLGKTPEKLEKDMLELYMTNVVGNVHLFNLFMPLLLQSNVKKVIAITSGFADPDPVPKHELYEAMPYSASKAALNMVVAKYAAQYGKDGVFFLALSPGTVDTGAWARYDEKKLLQVQAMAAKFTVVYPDFTGPIQPEESVRDMLSVIGRTSIENGDNGAFLSHKGNKEWL